MIGPEEQKKVCDHSIKSDDEHRKFELLFEPYIDNFIINTCSSTADSNYYIDGEHSNIAMVDEECVQIRTEFK